MTKKSKAFWPSDKWEACEFLRDAIWHCKFGAKNVNISYADKADLDAAEILTRLRREIMSSTGLK